MKEMEELKAEIKNAYSIINNYLDMIVKGNQQFSKLYDLINKLQAENESLKCCGNCKSYNIKVKDLCNLTGRAIFNPMMGKCDNWQPKEEK